jgi:hypothetical protein
MSTFEKKRYEKEYVALFADWKQLFWFQSEMLNILYRKRPIILYPSKKGNANNLRQNFKLLRSPRSTSKESISPGCEA